MPHQDYGDDELVRREQVVEPQNPPNSIVRPAARRTAVVTFVGGIVLFFVIATAAFLFWSPSGERTAPEGAEQTDPSAVGTSGERMPRENTPGGFDPAGRPESTQDELEFRGGGTTAAVTDLDALTSDSARAMAGRRVRLDDVEVERADGPAFWVKDGDASVAVQAAGGAPTVKAGQRIDLEGTVEAAGNESVRIRASRIDVK